MSKQYKDSLTNEEYQKMAEVREEYTEIFNKGVFNKEHALEVEKFIYGLSGKENPVVLICESPKRCQEIAALLPKIVPVLRVGMGLKEAEFTPELTQKIERIIYDEDYVQHLLKNLKIKNEAFGYTGDVSDLGWVSNYDFFHRIGLVKHEQFEKYCKIIKDANIFMSIQLERYVIICKSPKYTLKDPAGNPHSLEKEAVMFHDGFGIHFVHGLYFTPEEFEKYVVRKITFKELMEIEAADKRSVLLQDLMVDLLNDESLGMKLIDECDDPRTIVLDESVNKDGIKEYKTEVVNEVAKLYEFDYEDDKRHILLLKDHSIEKYTAHLVPSDSRLTLEFSEEMVDYFNKAYNDIYKSAEAALCFMNRGIRMGEFVQTS